MFPISLPCYLLIFSTFSSLGYHILQLLLGFCFLSVLWFSNCLLSYVYLIFMFRSFLFSSAEIVLNIWDHPDDTSNNTEVCSRDGKAFLLKTKISFSCCFSNSVVLQDCMSRKSHAALLLWPHSFIPPLPDLLNMTPLALFFDVRSLISYIICIPNLSFFLHYHKVQWCKNGCHYFLGLQQPAVSLGQKEHALTPCWHSWPPLAAALSSIGGHVELHSHRT